MLGGSDIKKMAAGLLHHHHGHGHNGGGGGGGSSTSPAVTSPNPSTAEQEKHFVAQFSELSRVLPPDEIQQNPRNKELGGSSKGLSVRDFDLVRTLGTGACFPLLTPLPPGGVRGRWCGLNWARRRDG